MNCYLKLYFTSALLLISVSLYAQKNQDISSEALAVFYKLIDSSEVYYSSGNYKKSIDVNMELLREAKKINNLEYIRLGYHYLGYDYIALNDSTMAKENFDRSEKYANLATNDTAKAVSYMDLASYYTTFSGKGYEEKAVAYHEKSINLLENIRDTLYLAYAYTNAAATYIKADELRKGYGHLINAKKYASLIYNSDPLTSGIELLMGQYYLKKKKYFQADQYFKNSINIAKKNNYDSDLMEAYKFSSESLKAQGRSKEAYESRLLYEKYKIKKDKTKSKTDTDAAIAQFQIDEYRKDKKAAETKTQLQTEITRNKKKQNYVLTVVTICALIVVVVFIITYIRRQHLLNELKVKNQEYLEAKEETERLAKSKSKFFSTVSHELRTPLYGVIGLSSILLEDKSLKKHEEDLKSLKFSANYLMALINDVLQINKIDANNDVKDKKEFNLRELVTTITTSIEYMRLQNKNKMKVEIETDVPRFLKGNDTRLSQILMNLIGNACKFTETGIVTVKVNSTNISKQMATLHFAIIDTGIGIAKEYQDSIFEEFMQAGNANYNYQGTGLGLPIVKKLLALENATIKLKSELGNGATFSFDITFEVVDTSRDHKSNIVLDFDLLKDKKILIVEDNRINQIVTKKILLKNGAICSLAENGEIAVNMTKNERFDVILMDINMPIKNGMEATKDIRLFNISIPIIALTAVEIEEMRQEIFESGMNDIIVKPYDIDIFKQTVIRNIISAENSSKMNEIAQPVI